MNELNINQYVFNHIQSNKRGIITNRTRKAKKIYTACKNKKNRTNPLIFKKELN